MFCIFCLINSWVHASFLYQETDPYCSLTGTTHRSFPWEVSDTSSWNIPTVYQWVCDETPEVSESNRDQIFTTMKEFFERKDFTWPVYGWEANWYGWDNTLNPDGQKYIQETLFPAMINFIIQEREKENPNMQHVAVINYAASTIGYDYFLQR